MKLKTIILKNFRSYREQFRIDIDDLTAFIGKNDIGKSTILEALEIFFNSEIVSIESQDACVHGENKDVRIGCVFQDLPGLIVLDSTATTTLADEYLLNENGDLEVIKVFDCNLKKPKETIYISANHPTTSEVSDLLTLKITELRTRATSLGVDTSSINMKSNVAIRKAIRDHVGALQLGTVSIPVNSEGAKNIWEMIQKELPIYFLFQSDRSSKDNDSEVQDPMKLAVAQALMEVEDDLATIQETVQKKAMELASRTLDKLREMDSSLASELSPNFKEDPKWGSIFKISLTGDDQIPINKRGSGVRRLILLNFFRAAAERKQTEKGSKGIIYAIEEPETAQHPSNQQLILNTLKELSEQDHCQVIITTHVPGLAGSIPNENIRFIDKNPIKGKTVHHGNEDIYEQIANTLGIFPDNRIRLFVCVEGPHDIRFLKHLSSMLHQVDPTLPDLSDEPRIALFPLGGSTLKEWVQNHYLKATGRPEVHIYDRDTSPPKYQSEYDEVNRRTDGSIAFMTLKKEMENYLHPDAIDEAMGVRVSFGAMDDVPMIVAREIHHNSPDFSKPWDEITVEKKKKKESQAKKRLNDEAAFCMTFDRLQKSDPDGEIITWLRTINDLLNQVEVRFGTTTV